MEKKAAERKMNPPQPPTRKDSLGQLGVAPNAANKRCVSAPIDISSVPFYQEVKSSLNVESGIQNGFPAPRNVSDLVSRTRRSSTPRRGFHRHSAPAKLLATTAPVIGL
ncbi:hypothetical protein KUCAC02_035338 [Chaenocephalus aceratus]|nr:hypothetical protein KUCAC02_035338 [Chaenocephalus aceratus]